MNKAVKKYRKRREQRLLNRWDSLDVETQALILYRRDAEEAWITVNEHPVKIDPKTKEVIGGAGGAMNGQTLSEAHPVSLEELNSNPKYEKGTERAASKGYKTKTGVEFPKPRSGAKWDTGILDEMADTYEERGLTKEFQAAVKAIKPEDITYQKDLNGNEVASVIGLAAKFDNVVKGKSKEVQKIYDEGIKNAPKITSDMLDICGKNGIMLSGLENNTKTGNSMARKINKKRADFAKNREEYNSQGKDGDKIYPELSDEEIAQTFTDNIRFTMISKHKDLAKNVTSVCELLEKQGYSINEVDNKYFPPTDGSDHVYKAVHLGVIAPSGEEVEIQIHSPEALRVKSKSHREKVKSDDAATAMKEALDKGNKAEYERQKKIKAEHDAKMVELWSSLSDPDGIKDLQNVNKKRDRKQEVIDRYNGKMKKK